MADKIHALAQLSSPSEHPTKLHSAITLLTSFKLVLRTLLKLVVEEGCATVMSTEFFEDCKHYFQRDGPDFIDCEEDFPLLLDLHSEINKWNLQPCVEPVEPVQLEKFRLLYQLVDDDDDEPIQLQEAIWWLDDLKMRLHNYAVRASKVTTGVVINEEFYKACEYYFKPPGPTTFHCGEEFPKLQHLETALDTLIEMLPWHPAGFVDRAMGDDRDDREAATSEAH